MELLELLGVGFEKDSDVMKCFDLSKNIQLVNLCKNHFEDIDSVIKKVSIKCPNLRNFYVVGEPKVKSIDLKLFPKLESINLKGCGYVALKGIKDSECDLILDKNFIEKYETLKWFEKIDKKRINFK